MPLTECQKEVVLWKKCKRRLKRASSFLKNLVEQDFGKTLYLMIPGEGNIIIQSKLKCMRFGKTIVGL